MFRFTIRDVLWLTVVVALTLGWWIDHRHTTAMRQAIELRLANDARKLKEQANSLALYRKELLRRYELRQMITAERETEIHGAGPWYLGVPEMEGPPGFGQPPKSGTLTSQP